MERRDLLKWILLTGLPLNTTAKNLFKDTMIRREIPGTGETVGAVGVGTWQTFDVGNSKTRRAELKKVLEILVSAGGSVVDSSPMYGTSEEVVGDLSETLGYHKKLFKATKVWINGQNAGIEQMQKSMREMRAPKIDLMQIHNLVDWKTHLKTLYNWKERGLIKYIGITHYLDSAHGEMERIIKNEKIDFIQMNYSINDTHAANSLIPTAKDIGVAVLVNRPYAGGSLFRKMGNVNLPPWTKDLEIKSWGQYFLKYILATDGVTCVIPGTGNEKHAKDNVRAGFGVMPNRDELYKMKRFFESI